MLSLTHSPLSEFAWKGKIYKVDLAFDTVLLYFELLQDNELTETDKFIQTCKLFFGKQELPNDPDFFTNALEVISKEITSNPYGNSEEGGVDGPKQFDYVKDAGAIYASFFAQYHIDLNKERGKMPWTIFKALFDGLNDNTYFQRILSIRNRDPNEIDDVKLKTQIIELQDFYAINSGKSEAERTADAFNNDQLSSFFNQFTD